jgi:hypothetical protein
MKKMIKLNCIAAFCITILSACNGNPETKEGEKLASTNAISSETETFNESSTYNQKISRDYALACIKAYDSVYDINNICKNEKAIAKAFTKSIGFPRHTDSLDIAKWIANLVQDSATKNYEGVRIKLGIYVDPKPKSFNLSEAVINKISAVDASGGNKIGRLTAFLWAYKTKKNTTMMKAAADSTNNIDLGEPLNLGDLKP